MDISSESYQEFFLYIFAFVWPQVKKTIKVLSIHFLENERLNIFLKSIWSVLYSVCMYDLLRKVGVRTYDMCETALYSFQTGQYKMSLSIH